MYLPIAGVGSYGVHPVASGLETYFKPWYFTGRVVHWGRFYPTRDTAMNAAKRMAKHFTSA